MISGEKKIIIKNTALKETFGWFFWNCFNFSSSFSSNQVFDCSSKFRMGNGSYILQRSWAKSCPLGYKSGFKLYRKTIFRIMLRKYWSYGILFTLEASNYQIFNKTKKHNNSENQCVISYHFCVLGSFEFGSVHIKQIETSSSTICLDFDVESEQARQLAKITGFWPDYSGFIGKHFENCFPIKPDLYKTLYKNFEIFLCEIWTNKTTGRNDWQNFWLDYSGFYRPVWSK